MADQTNKTREYLNSIEFTQEFPWINSGLSRAESTEELEEGQSSGLTIFIAGYL